MHLNRILILTAIALAAITAGAAVAFLGARSGDTDAPSAAPSAATPSAPPVVATPDPPATPPAPEPTPTAEPTPLVIRPEATPEPSGDEAAEERPDKAPWVYYFPTQWVPDVTTWPEAYRWQDPLPTIEPPLGWTYDTYRTPYPTFGEPYRDRPFILTVGDDEAFDDLYPGALIGAVEELTPQLDRDMRAIFRTHQELLAAWDKVLETHEVLPIEPYVARSLDTWIRDELVPMLQGRRISAAGSPFVHEIVAMAIYGDRAEVLQVYRNSIATYYHVDDRSIVHGGPPAEAIPIDNITYTYAQWERIDGRWFETFASFLSDYPDQTPAQWLVGRSPWLVPYIELWEAAFAQERVARGQQGS